MKNTEHFRDEFFRGAIEDHARAYEEHFGARLAGLYVCGSAHRNEAVPRVSDIDLQPFIRDTYGSEDEEWRKDAHERLVALYPSTDACCPARSVSTLMPGQDATGRTRDELIAQAFRFRLRYDATRVSGEDLIAGLRVVIPDARLCFESPLALVRFGAGESADNPTDFSLPSEPFLRVRKIARLAVLGGAYLLMHRGEFHGFAGEYVIGDLAESNPQWRAFLSRTADLYVSPPAEAAGDLHGYTAATLEWMNWIDSQMKEASNRALQ